MEMQNETKGDDVRKRSRFYQGLMDVPILKSGENTKYKQLSSTVIIFITQDDIFGRNLASKNGAPELVSVLQYVKDTNMENPGIIIKDSRILELDEIVNEVRESEEWEVVRMNILEIGKEIGIKELVVKVYKKGKSVEEIAELFEKDVEDIKRIVEEFKASG